MTVRTRAELNSDADAHIEDNTTGNVTPADVRGRVKDLADSALLPEDIGTTVQGYSANLAEWSGINPSANGGSLVAAADYAAMRALLDLEAGTDFYSISAANSAFAAASHSHTVSALSDASADARSFLQAANYAAMKTLLSLVKADVGLGNVANVAQLEQGVHEMPIPAAAMWPKATSGAEEITYDSGANDITIRALAFDTTTQEYAQFVIPMPKGWNEGTVTFIPYWTNTGGASTQTVVWSLAGLALGDSDAINGAFGTAQTSSDTWLAQNDVHIGPESSAITIGGSPAENDLVVFEISRVVASDNMAGDAVLIGIKLRMTLNAGTDA